MAEIALRQIRAIIAVCEEGSFTRAAARENATQSGISQHVATAERTLGVKLFERSAAGVTPTPAGRRYYERCVEAVGQLENAREEARGMAKAVSGDLRIGLIPTLPLLGLYLPLRWTWTHEARAVRRALRIRPEDPLLTEFLARRAVVNFSYDRLLAVSQQPYRDLEEGRHEALARLELERLGIQRRSA